MIKVRLFLSSSHPFFLNFLRDRGAVGEETLVEGNGAIRAGCEPVVLEVAGGGELWLVQLVVSFDFH